LTPRTPSPNVPSPSIAGAVVLRHADKAAPAPEMDTPSIKSAAKEADHAREAVARMLDAAKAIRADTTMTDAAKALALAEMGRDTETAILKRLDGAADRLRQAATDAEAEARRAVRADQVHDAAELRRVIREKAERKGEGFAAVRRMIADGDRGAVAAILNGHPLTSGLTPQEHAALDQLARQTFAPEAMARADRALAAMHSLSTVAGAISATTDGLAKAREAVAAAHAAAETQRTTAAVKAALADPAS